ncbi:MAG: hypothetical protein NVS9B1_27290 [Candidatus Dormibacteraceae bacterium]
MAQPLLQGGVPMIPIALALVALILAAIEQFRAQGQSLLAWAVICLAVIHLLGVHLS